jgi:hypothetical protein
VNPDGLEANYYYGGGRSESFVTPLSLCIFVAAALLILLLPRKYATVPFLVAGILLPMGQTVVIGGLHLYLLRLLILIGYGRVIWAGFLTRRDRFPGPLNPLDKIVLLWACCNAITYTILWGAVGALIVKLGFLYNALGSYFLLRYLIRDREDVVRAIKILALVCVVCAPLVLMEHATGQNYFSALGHRLVSDVRYGKVRAEGPFAQSIINGTLGAMLVPLFAALWWQGRGHRLAAALGVVSSTAMVISSSSSTPIMTYLAGILALCLWRFRDKMRAFRWGLVFSLIGLQMVMKAPIWSLIGRVSAISGGTGWHRAELIHQSVLHFWEWWLIGTTRNAYWGLDMWDSDNAFVNAGTEGGLITFILFLTLFVRAYRRIGVGRRLVVDDRKHERLIWALGACLFANTVAFFGIVYFDQSSIAWYALLVMITAATASFLDAKPAEAKVTGLTYGALQPAPADPEHLRTWNER